ncbi:MAG TPA: hypothetical protein VGL55_14305 [Steroidobacteraceae bacterium]|jgi:hypothetical protein
MDRTKSQDLSSAAAPGSPIENPPHKSLAAQTAGAALGMASAHFGVNRSAQREEKGGTEMSRVPVQGGMMIAFSTDFPN